MLSSTGKRSAKSIRKERKKAVVCFKQCRAKFRKYFLQCGGEFSFKGPSRFPNHTWMKGGRGRGDGGGDICPILLHITISTVVGDLYICRLIEYLMIYRGLGFLAAV
jgi:hypothetical protein